MMWRWLIVVVAALAAWGPSLSRCDAISEMPREELEGLARRLLGESASFGVASHSAGPRAAEVNMTAGEVEDWTALEQLWTAANGPNWDLPPANNWNFTEMEPVCPFKGWFGVHCGADGRVVEVEVHVPGAAGELPRSMKPMSELVALKFLDPSQVGGEMPMVWEGHPNLRVLIINNQQLTGPLYSTALTLPSLSTLELRDNSLTGGMPYDWSHAPSISSVDLRGNSISGLVPSKQWTGTGVLTSLRLDNNEIGGTFPTFWEGVGSLLTLNLANTRVSGTMPDTFYSGLATLTELDLSNTLLSGTLSGTLQGFNSLYELSVAGSRLSGTFPSVWTGVPFLINLSAGTPRLSGTLPGKFRGISSLKVLELQNTEISGTVPSSFASMERLTTLDVSGSLVSGSIPTNITGLPLLQALRLARCNLAGTLPSGLVGVPYLNELDVSDNRVSGTVSGNWAGMPRLSKLNAGTNEISGSLPTSWSGVMLERLSLSANRLSGGFPPTWNSTDGSLNLLVSLDLSHNPALGGTLPSPAIPGLRSVSILQLSDCGLSGTWPRWKISASLIELDISFNRLSGELSLEFSTHTQVDATHNELTSITIDEFATFGSLRVGQNRLSGALPESLCQSVNADAAPSSIDAYSNRLTSVPGCYGDLPGLLELDLSDNLISEIPANFAMSAQGQLRTLRLGGNRLTGASLLMPPTHGEPSHSRLTELDLSNNPLHLNAMNAINRFQTSFPVLTDLRLGNTSLFGMITDSSLRLSSIDCSSNPAFLGFSSDTSLNQLNSINVSDSPLATPPSYLGALEYYRNSAPNRGRVCVPPGLLQASRVHEIDARGSAERSSCVPRMRPLLVPSETEQRYFPADNLTCPQWLTVNSGGVVRGSAAFMAYERCRCTDGNAWDRGAGRCVQTRPDLAGLVKFDPFVLSARPCVLGNNYPVMREGSSLAAAHSPLPLRAGDLAAVDTVLACRRPGACNTGGAACVERVFQPSTHTNADPPDPPLEYSCATGHDPLSLMCSRCTAGYWTSGESCVPCRSSFRWLVPLTMSLMLVGALALLVLKAGRGSNGYRTLSIALFWLQVTALLEASAQVQSAQARPTTWRWLSTTREVVQSWAVVEPWAASCVSDGFGDFGPLSWVLFAAPAAVATTGTLVWLLVGRTAHGRARTTYATGYALQALFLPVCARALQVFNCEDAGGHRFVSAAPYVACGGFGPLRAAAVAVLVLYCAPLLALSAALPWRRFRRRDREMSAGGKRLALPLLPGISPADAPSTSTELVMDQLLLSTLRAPRALWFWPALYEGGRGLGLALAIGLLPVSSTLLPVSVFIILAVSVVAHTQVRPSRHALDNTLEAVVLVAALAVYLVSIVGGNQSLRSGGSGGGGGGGVDVSASDNSGGTGARALVSIIHVLVLCVLSCAIAFRRTATRLLCGDEAASASAAAEVAAGESPAHPDHMSEAAHASREPSSVLRSAAATDVKEELEFDSDL